MAPAGRTRPSLLGTAAATEPSQDFQLSILDALNAPEAGATARPARTRRPLLQYALTLLGVGAAVTASAFLWAQVQEPPVDTLEVAVANVPTPATKAPPAPSVATPAPSAQPTSAASAEVAASGAARIEDLGAATAVAAAAVTPTTTPASPFDKLAGGTPEASAAVPTQDKPKQATRAKTPPAKRQPAGTGNAPARSTTAKATPAPNAKTARTAAAKPPVASRQAAKLPAQGDADVEIMAALIGHMNETAAAADSAGSPDASIADLVRHCRSLPGSEALACQKRICQGYWGRADACPARERQAALRTTG